MHYVVCIKQVPETTDVRINPETKTLMREGVAAIVNPFDMYAIEEALRMKERQGGKITVLTMGPPQAESALREALSMGCDEAILVSDRAFAGSDTWATSYTLAQAIRKIGDATVILCGKQASDGDTAQVGPGIAMHLDLPQITYVRKIESMDERHIVAQRLMDDGIETVESPLPALLTVIKELNEPRLPSLKGKLNARKVQIVTWSATDLNPDPKCLGLDGSPTKVVRIFSPAPRGGGQMLQGEPDELVTQLVEKLKDVVLAARS